MNPQINDSTSTADRRRCLQLNPSPASSLEPVKLARAKVNLAGLILLVVEFPV